MKLIAMMTAVVVLVMTITACGSHVDANRTVERANTPNEATASNTNTTNEVVEVPTDTSREDESASAEVWIHVDGMTKVQGITWVGWPNIVEEALLGLDGIIEHEVVLQNDRFRVVYNPNSVDPAAMLAVIDDVGFTGSIVEDGGKEGLAPKVKLDVTELAEKTRAVFQTASSANRLILIDIHGPGWKPCVKMERVTYPSPAVKSVLDGGYIRQVLDVEDDRETTELFQPDAIPVAIVLNTEGLELGRKVGFVEPEAYAEWLASFQP